MRRTILAFLTLCMIVSTLSGMTLTVGAASSTATEVWYCGQKLDADTPYLHSISQPDRRIVMSSANQSEAGYSLYATFDAEKGTLTFNDGGTLSWNHEKSTAPINDDAETYYGIYANGSLTIDMAGHRHWLYSGGTPKTHYGIYVNGDLTITGSSEGTIMIQAAVSDNTSVTETDFYKAYGVYAEGDLYLNGGLIDIYSGGYAPEWENSKYNSVRMIAADNVHLNGGRLNLRGRHKDMVANFKLFDLGENSLTIPDYYEQKWCSDPGDPSSDGRSNIGSSIHDAYVEGDQYVELKPGAGYEISVAGIAVGGSKKYLVPDGEGWAASDKSNGAVAEYDAATRTLSFIKDATISCPEGTWVLRYCIKSESDLVIEIPEDVTVTLEGLNTQRNKIIWAQGNITICGGGTLDADTSKDWGGTVDESGVIWADGGDVVIKDSITAKLYTRDLTESQLAQVIYASGSIKIQEYATVIMGTDIGYVLKQVPQIYPEAKVQMAMEANSNGNGTTPKSDLIPYDNSKITDIKYLIIEPMPMELKAVNGLDDWKKLALNNPKLDLEFNLEIGAVPSAQELVVNNGAEIERAEIDGDNPKILHITFANVKANESYKLDIKSVKNKAGLKYTGEYDFIMSSGCDVLGVTLNGNESGTVQTTNTVAVSLAKAEGASEMNALVTVVVWENVTVGENTVKKLKSVQSEAALNITGSTSIQVENINADADDTIQVFVWDGGSGLNVLSRTVEFNN